MNTTNLDNIILGIDPGTRFLGYGIIHQQGSKQKLLSLGTVDMSKMEESTERLKTIFEKVSYLIDTYQPHECAIEAPFHGKNVQSMLKLGRAQGVAIAAMLAMHKPVYEYAPKKVKLSVTGNGNASKEQVAGMLQRIFTFESMPSYLDATDGLAVAVCHAFQRSSPAPTGSGGKKANWSSFLSANPDRIARFKP